MLSRAHMHGLLVAALVLAGLSGCGGGHEGGGFFVPAPSAISVVSGNGQTGTAGAMLASPLVVLVTGPGGIPLANVPVTFATSGGGTFGAPSATTNAQGEAQTTFTLGNTPGPNAVTASVPGVSTPAAFAETGGVATAARVTATSPSVNGTVGSTVSLAVTVTDAAGNPVANATVTFTLASGGGSLSSGSATTNTQGQAQVVLTLPTTAGTTTVTAQVSGASSSATVTATASPGLPASIAFVATAHQAPAGATILPAVQVKVTDSFGNGVSTVVTLTIATGAGTLGGGGATSTTNGVAAFPGLSIDTAGSFTLQAQGGGLTVTCPSFTIGAIPAIDGLGHMDDLAFNFMRGASNDAPGPSVFDQPFGTALDLAGHRLFVSDFINNRVLVFNLSATNTLAGMPHLAAFVLGQPDFVATGSATTQSGMQNPNGLAFDATNNRLFVACGSNNRVLVFDTATISNGMNASLVLGQPDFISGAAATTQSGMSGPVDVAIDSANSTLYVADNNNMRVLVFSTTALANGMNASFVVGQTTFTTSTAGTTQSTIQRPIGVAVDPVGGRLFVADDLNNRVLVFATPIAANGPNASSVLGQTTFTGSSGGLSQSQLNIPERLSFDGGHLLYVGDPGNDRVLVFDTTTITDGMNASFVLGQSTFTTGAPATTQSGVSGPNGVVATTTVLFVVDQSNNRVLEFDVAAIANGMNASDGLGHMDPIEPVPVMSFTRGARDDSPSGSTLSNPAGVALDTAQHRLYVADGSNNRILVFALSATNDLTGVNRDAAFVLGQPDFVTRSPGLTQSGLSSPAGVSLDAATGRLFVADSLNNRVLVFDTAALANGMNASFVLGEPDFTTSTGALTQNGTSLPADVSLDANGRLFVLDGGNNRVLVFDTTALANGMNASFVLGEPDFTTSTNATTQSGLNDPHGIACDAAANRLYVSDTDSSRVLVFDTTALANGMNASFVIGQTDFTSGTQATTQRGLSFPVGLGVDGTDHRLYVSDTGNSRVLVFDTGALANGMNAESVIGQPTFTASAAGTSATTLSLPPAGASGIAVDAATNHVFVTDLENNRVLLYTFP